ncbi:MAG: hypothetical protein AAGC95_02145 [Pseudomonadota bacterium]
MQKIKPLCIAITASFIATLSACSNEQQEREAATPPPETSVAKKQPVGRGLKDALNEMDESCDRDLAKTTITQCRVCHSFNEGEPHRTGPNLFGVYGANAAMAEKFAYSPVLQNAGLVWDDETLDAFLENPPRYLPGNRMAFGGVRDADSRSALICFLRALK